MNAAFRSAGALAALLCLASAVTRGAELRQTAVPGTALVLGVPADWTAVAPADGTVLRFASRDRTAGLAVSVQISPDQGPAAFTQTSLADLQQLAYDFDLVDWDFTARAGGRPWSRLHFRFVLGERRWEEQLWLTVVDGRAIAVSCCAAPDAWAAWSPVFDRCLDAGGASRPVLASPR